MIVERKIQNINIAYNRTNKASYNTMLSDTGAYSIKAIWMVAMGMIDTLEINGILVFDR